MILRLHILRGKLDKVNGFICSHLLRERSYRLQRQIPPSSVAKQGVQGVGIVSHITQNKQTKHGSEPKPVGSLDGVHWRNAVD